MTMRWLSWLMVGLTATSLAWQSLAWSSGASANDIDLSGSLIESPASGNLYFVGQVLDDLAQADVVYLGESHDQPDDHLMQRLLIEVLYNRRLAEAPLEEGRLAEGQPGPAVLPPRNFAIALEMFQRPFQPLLDQYVAGEISETDLREQSEYDTRWGFPWEYYAPILRFARAHQIPLLALNTPVEITHQVAQKGLNSLSEQQQQWVPTELDLVEPEYAQLLQRFYQEIHVNHSNSREFERFFLIQTLWDETMAAGVTDFLERHREAQVVVLSGQGHIVYDFGIPNRVARRLGSQSVAQRTVLLSPEPDAFALETSLPLADYLWFSLPPE
ncbi:MAG: ChaN family lipoprotein [Cyanobacteria bacterium P01_A01_bin.114]